MSEMASSSKVLCLTALLGLSHAISTSQQFSDSWQRAVNLTRLMTNEEKANLTTGIGLVGGRCSGNTGSVPRLGFPSLCLQDGPTGVRSTDGVSVFAAEVNAASTWDMELVYQQALSMGTEFKNKGINQALAPVTGGPLGRSPYNGRNWEGYGADPYLHGMASYWGVKGIQDAGVIATPKHLVAYEQETYRYTGILQSIAGGGVVNPANNTNAEQISSEVSARTLRELYLWPFEEMMSAKPLSIMCSYNRLNGSDACADGTVLNSILKDEWNFPGFVVSDWGSVFMAASTSGTANNGLDMDMPGGEGLWGLQLVNLTSSGNITQARLDDMVHRILFAYYELGQDKNFPSLNYDTNTYADAVDKEVVNEHVDVRADHHKVIQKIGEDSAVLLKNTNTSSHGLPLRRGARLAIFGTDAGIRPDGNNYGATNIYPANSTNNGTIADGWGSGTGHYSYLIDPLSAIAYSAIDNRWSVQHVLRDYPVSNDPETLNLFDAASAEADTCLVFASALSGEGLDRDTLHLDNRADQLIQYIANRCSNTIVITHAVGPTNLEIAYGHPNVTAILSAGLPGQESGRSLVRVLSGEVNPSGKLVYTILQRDSDYIGVYNTSNIQDPREVFSEDLLIDYRAADAKNLGVRFEFGFGLSYTTFSYDNITLTAIPSALNAIAGPSDTLMTVTVDVMNTGTLTGAEVSQLYLSYPASAAEPIRVLRGFAKMNLSPDESRTVKFALRKKDISIWSEAQSAWVVPTGIFTIAVGSSSRRLPLNTTFTM